ncbi:MAG: cobyrinate a,c-diamide synthase [Chloroflexi bacterium]|nr:cobyrinate a,c-diamide synthase [Chloroflexota bacterium]MDA1228090.1 cobyrinate a,c-diamide synthase [Chloroflexota bacterium]
MTPTIVIAGTRSGVGKTTITTGIMGALARRGLKVQPFKCGPDYIDPSYHRMACGVASRNLDTWLLSYSTVLECFGRANDGRDVSVVEGVMGLYDGHANLTEEGSTAEVAKLLRAPVILIVDAAKVARSVAAEVLGYQKFDPSVDIAGVILNGIGSPRHLEFCKPPIEEATGLPVIGYMPRREDLKAPERHLGLVPVVEGPVAEEWLGKLIDQIEKTIDLEKLLEIAARADTPTVQPSIYPVRALPKRTKIAVAMDKAFNFYYEDSLDLLDAWGAEVVPFSPLGDDRLPEGVGGVYLGGGFPEIYAADLAENEAMLGAIRNAGAANIPIYAECGGLMYLGTSLTDFDGNRHQMAGLLPLESSMEKSRLTLGYREVKALADGPLLSKGQETRGHEFHWSFSDLQQNEADAAYAVVSQDDRAEGIRKGSVWASYIHLHLGSEPGMAQRWVETCAGVNQDKD